MSANSHGPTLAVPVDHRALIDAIAAAVDRDPDRLEAALDGLARGICARIERLDGSAVQRPDRWLDTREAAEYLGTSPSALHKLTAAQAIPFSQERAGCRCYFRTGDLDWWMRGGCERGARRRPSFRPKTPLAAGESRHGLRD